jgi:predicted kinase
MLIVISGLPGTGKTAVAAAVAKRLHAVHLSVDPVEDAMLGAELERGWVTGVAAYEAVRVMAEGNLVLGATVVVDAVNDSEAARDTWRTASRMTALPVTFVLLSVSDPTEHQRRLEQRTRELRHIGEPTWDQVRARAAAYEPWVGDHEEADATPPLDAVINIVLERLPV